MWDWIWFREENESFYYVIWRCMFVVCDMVLYVLLPTWIVLAYFAKLDPITRVMKEWKISRTHFLHLQKGEL